MNRILLLSTITFIISFSVAQTPEWDQYCKLRNIVGHEILGPDSAYRIYTAMDSVYNGIPFFTDLYDYLKAAIALGMREKTQEIAFRLVQWKCWDYRLFDQPDVESIKKTHYWPRLDSLSRMYGDKMAYNEYIIKLYDMQINDQRSRRPLHDNHTREELDSIWIIIHQTDSLNLLQLKELISQYGFPTWEKVGYHYAFCAWLIAQHSDSVFLHHYVEMLKKAVADNNANPADLAYMIDRDLMNRDLPQIYGTQKIGFYDDNGNIEYMLWPVDNMEAVNARREHMLLDPIDTVGIKIFDNKMQQR